MSARVPNGNGVSRHQLYPSHLEITPEAKETLGLALRAMALPTGLPVDVLLDFIDMEAYWNADTGNLLCVLRMADNGEDMLVEIPEPHWDLKPYSQETH